MPTVDGQSNVAAFRNLHASGLLCLPNAWDAGSARLVESLGAKAVATTSAGVAWAAGYADGNRMPPDVVVSVASNIARVIRVPLSVDIEAGYSSDPNEVAALALRLAEAGAAGINLEDGTQPPDLLARKIDAVKATLSKAGTDLFVNARTDVYLARLVGEAQRVDEVSTRAGLYEKAGADGLFVPGISALADMQTVAGDTRLPLNVMSWDGLPSPEQLLGAGVRRLSAGGGISARVWAQAAALSRQFLQEGRLDGEAMPYPDLQRLFG